MEVLARVLRFAGCVAAGRDGARVAKAWAAAYTRLVHVHTKIVDARLPEAEGMAFVDALDLGRLAVVLAGHASYAGANLENVSDLNELRSSESGYAALTEFTAKLWTHWSSCYPRMVAHVSFDDAALAAAPGGDARRSLALARVVRSGAERWARDRVTGNFWIVGERKDGTILVAEGLADAYVVAGHVTSLFKMLRARGPPPHYVRLTLLPSGDRVTYDGLVAGCLPPSRPSLKLLRRVYARAVDTGRLVASLPRLAAVPAAPAPAFEAEFSGEAKRLRDRLVGAPARPDDMDEAGTLTFRRFGYTPIENPNKMIALLRGNGEAVTAFATGALEPTIEEILRETVSDFARTGMAPNLLLVDHEPLIAPLNALLSESTPCRAHYYPPPSPEETGLYGRADRGGADLGRRNRIAISPATDVTIVGLTGRTDLNGAEGEVLGGPNERGRYAVALKDGSRISARPGNLLQHLPVTRATDGATGVIAAAAVDRDAGDGEDADEVAGDDVHGYLVRRPPDAGETDARGAAVDVREWWPASDTVLPAGVCVRCDGVNRDDWRGVEALIVKVDVPKRKYTVKNRGGHVAKIKFAAVRV